MMNTSFAVYIGIVYSYLPFMILPLYSNLEKHDLTLLEAAQDLGAGPTRAFLRITLPLSMPGIVAGSLLVFIPAVGEYVIPSLLGSSDELMIARLLSDEFFLNRDWPKASAVAIVMLLLLVLPIMVFQHFQNKELEAASDEDQHENAGPFLQEHAVAGLRVPVRAHLHDDPVLVQRLAVRDELELGHLAVAQVVPAPGPRTTRCCRRRGCPSRWRPCRRPARSSWERWPGWSWRASAGSAAAPSCRA